MVALEWSKGAKDQTKKLLAEKKRVNTKEIIILCE